MWSPAQVPTLEDNVTIASGHVISLTVTAFAKDLTIVGVLELNDISAVVNVGELLHINSGLVRTTAAPSDFSSFEFGLSVRVIFSGNKPRVEGMGAPFENKRMFPVNILGNNWNFELQTDIEAQDVDFGFNINCTGSSRKVNRVFLMAASLGPDTLLLRFLSSKMLVWPWNLCSISDLPGLLISFPTPTPQFSQLALAIIPFDSSQRKHSPFQAAVNQ